MKNILGGHHWPNIGREIGLDGTTWPFEVVVDVGPNTTVIPLSEPHATVSNSTIAKLRWKPNLGMLVWAKYLPHNDYFGEGHDVVIISLHKAFFRADASDSAFRELHQRVRRDENMEIES